MCQGWYVQKLVSSGSPSYSDCQALCTQSANCGATTFQDMGSVFCARDTACPTCFSLSASPHSRASGRHSPTAQLPTRAAPLPGRLHALQGPDRVPGGRFHLLRQQRSLLFQLGGCRLYDPRGDQGGLHLLHACLSVSVATSVAAALAAAALAAALALAAAALATAHVAGASLPSLGSLRLQVPRLVRPEV